MSYKNDAMQTQRNQAMAPRTAEALSKQEVLRALSPTLRTGAEVMSQPKAAPAAPAKPAAQEYQLSRKEMEEMLLDLAARVKKSERKAERLERAFDEIAALHMSHADAIVKIRRKLAGEPSRQERSAPAPELENQEPIERVYSDATWPYDQRGE